MRNRVILALVARICTRVSQTNVRMRCLQPSQTDTHPALAPRQIPGTSPRMTRERRNM